MHEGRGCILVTSGRLTCMLMPRVNRFGQSCPFAIRALNIPAGLLKQRQLADNRVMELVNRRDRCQIRQPQQELGTAVAEEHFQLFFSL